MIIKHGVNQTEVQFLDLLILISYETPVAIFDKELKKIFITETKHSVTTTRHVNKWIQHLIREFSLLYKEDSPMSYGSSTQKTLDTVWKLAVTEKSLKQNITIDGELKDPPTPQFKLKDRVHKIMEE
jgi:hypothetical protein